MSTQMRLRLMNLLSAMATDAIRKTDHGEHEEKRTTEITEQKRGHRGTEERDILCVLFLTP